MKLPNGNSDLSTLHQDEPDSTDMRLSTLWGGGLPGLLIAGGLWGLLIAASASWRASGPDDMYTSTFEGLALASIQGGSLRTESKSSVFASQSLRTSAPTLGKGRSELLGESPDDNRVGEGLLST